MSRIDRASRTVKVAPDRVYAALIDPDALSEWLPPAGMRAEFERFDARPAGGYRMVLTYLGSDGSPGKSTADSDVVEARYVELSSPDGVPGSRIDNVLRLRRDGAQPPR